jgi:uncharacterized membrane protein
LGEGGDIMNLAVTLLTLAAVLGSGLIAGLFFTFSTFVMQALAQVAPQNGIRTMQAINRTVMNPLTMGFFMGTALLSVAIIAYAAFTWSNPQAPWLIAGGALYLASFVITAGGNVPMNNALETKDAASDEAAAYWQHYLSRWLTFNHVRAVAASLATVAYAYALYAAAG